MKWIRRSMQLALRTAGKIHGFASSPRYAPTLRSIFWGKVSLSQRSFKAKMPSGGSRETFCQSSDVRIQPGYPHLEDMLHLPSGGAIAVDVDGRWSTICCRRVVAVSMVGAVTVGGEEGENGCSRRAAKDFICKRLRRVTTTKRCRSLAGLFWGEI